MIVIDKLCYQSGLRYVNGTEKFLYAVLTLVFCIGARSFAVAGTVFIINGILTVWKGEIPLSRYLKLLTVPAVFLILGTAAILVNLSDVPMDAFAIEAGRWYITGSRASVLEGLRLCAVAMASVSCLYFLSLNTTMTDILGVLARFHTPPLLIELMMLIYRFIFILLESASAIRTSQEARMGYRNFRLSLRSFGTLSVSLFIRAIRRSSAMYDAMESRCYDGRIRVLPCERSAQKKEIALIAGYEMLLAAAMIWSVIG